SILASSVPAQVDPGGRSVLFIRGADGSGGAKSGGSFLQRTEQLSDVHNRSMVPGNHGYGALRDLLMAEGFRVSQWIESPKLLTRAVLQGHRIIVWGSNNKVLAASEIQAFHAYIDAGGSALFLCDADWGSTFGAAPASDNQLLARYGVTVHQDSGQTPRLARSEHGRYLILEHPLLSGPDGAGGADDVGSYDGAGISLFRIGRGSSGFQAISLVSALGMQKRLNTPTGKPGALLPADKNDAAMFVVEKGNARIVGHFDRNSFFNKNGYGSQLAHLDNASLARNIFRFLASVPASARSAGQGCGLAGKPILMASLPILGRRQALGLTGAAPQAPLLLLVSPGRARPVPVPGGCVLQVDAQGLVLHPAGVTDARGEWRLSWLLPSRLSFSGFRLTIQGMSMVARAPFLGWGELSNGVELRAGFPR
ncbi:MAG: hypothetical protein ACE5F1_22085, partial [Planctomycetota bacterium]